MNKEKSHDVSLNIAFKRFTEENNRHETLDTKASMVLGFSGILTGLLLNALLNIINNQKETHILIDYFIFATLILALTAIVLTGIFTLAVLWPREYSAGPENKILIHMAEKNSEEEFKKIILPAYANAFQNNYDLNEKKVQFLYFAFLSLTFGIFITFLSFILISYSFFS